MGRLNLFSGPGPFCGILSNTGSPSLLFVNPPPPLLPQTTTTTVTVAQIGACLDIFNCLLAEHVPAVAQMLNEIGIQCDMFLIDWCVWVCVWAGMCGCGFSHIRIHSTLCFCFSPIT